MSRNLKGNNCKMARTRGGKKVKPNLESIKVSTFIKTSGMDGKKLLLKEKLFQKSRYSGPKLKNMFFSKMFTSLCEELEMF